MISEGSFMDSQGDSGLTSYGQKRGSNQGNAMNLTTSKSSSLNRELFGFRRKAKQYFETTTQRFRDYNNERDPLQDCVVSRSRSECDANGADVAQSKILMEMLFKKANNDSKQELEKVTEGAKYELNLSTTPRSIPDLLCEAVYHDAHGELLLASPESESVDMANSDGRRIVVFQELPKNIGVANLLSQICGGPLEKVLYACDNQKDASNVVYVELHFLFAEDAGYFMRYARFQLFKVNGVHLVPRWGHQEATSGEQDSLYDIQEYIKPELCKAIQNFDSIGARRCLIMKKYTRKHRSLCKEINAKSHIYDLDIEQIINDFNKFGHILEVSPLISRKLCLQICFTDIRSAIEAMKSYETSNSYINDRYFRDWSIWYGKDIVDKPCIEV